MHPGRWLVRTVIAGALLIASVAGPGRASAVGPTIVHVPALFAMRGAPVSVSMYATCDTACAGRLFYRETAASSEITGTSDPSGWHQVAMGQGSPVSLGTVTVYNFFATIPGGDTRGWDYMLKVIDGPNVAYSPGTPAVPAFGVTKGARTGWYHVYVTNPSQIAHAPVAQIGFRRPIDLSADATCASACSATLFYRRTGYLLPSGLDFADPPADPAAGSDVQWQTMAMKLVTVTPVGSAGADRYQFTAQIPSAYVDTRGVDYAIRVTDGRTRAWSPGTSYSGWYMPEDGLRIGWYHVHVMNPVLGYHAQQQFAAPRAQAISLSAAAICWTDSCSAKLYYHSFGGPIRAINAPPGVVSYLLDSRGINFTATITAADVVAPTLSYWFEITDGYTKVFAPGTAYNGYYASVDGIQTGEYTISVG